MPNPFISAIIALFFSGKATTETEEKTRCTSWWSPVIYGILATLVGTFFYKTYQVTTIYNMVSVNPMYTYYDERDSCPDFINSITFYTRFSGDGTYRDNVNSLLRDQGRAASIIANNGGVMCELGLPTKDFNHLRWNPNIPKEAIDYYNTLPGIRHMYSFGFMTNQLPSLMPFMPSWKWREKGWTLFDRDYQLFYRTEAEPMRGNKSVYVRLPKEVTRLEDDQTIDDASYLFGDGTILTQIVCDRASEEKYKIEEGVSYNICAGGNEVNVLHFFTAADISQFTYIIGVESPLPVKYINMMADIPIEIATPMDSTTIATTGFSIEGGITLEAARRSSLSIHIKLPTLANLQLIRSLILTTLLTALLSLFGMSLYYCLRRAAMNYRSSHELSEEQKKLISPRRVKTYHTTLIIIFIALVIAMLRWCWMLATDKPLLVLVGSFLEYRKHYIIAATILLLLLLLTLFYRWAYTPIPPRAEPGTQPEDSEDKDEEDLPGGFVFNPDNLDDLDKIFEGLPEEDMIELAEQEEAARKAEEEETRRKAEEQDESSTATPALPPADPL